MKRIPVIAMLVILLILPTLRNAEAGRRYDDSDDDLFRGDEISIDFDNGVLSIESGDYDDFVEITEDYQLLINGHRVKTNNKQEKLLRQYYNDFDDITGYAREIGIEGARVGAKGARLGLKAVASIVKLVLEDYDTDDLQKDMEKETEKIERAAKRLEKKAEKLERIAKDFKKTHKKLRKSISELDDLGWF